jgi:hypothetical protein
MKLPQIAKLGLSVIMFVALPRLYANCYQVVTAELCKAASSYYYFKDCYVSCLCPGVFNDNQLCVTERWGYFIDGPSTEHNFACSSGSSVLTCSTYVANDACSYTAYVLECINTGIPPAFGGYCQATWTNITKFGPRTEVSTSGNCSSGG